MAEFFLQQGWSAPSCTIEVRVGADAAGRSSAQKQTTRPFEVAACGRSLATLTRRKARESTQAAGSYCLCMQGLAHLADSLRAEGDLTSCSVIACRQQPARGKCRACSWIRTTGLFYSTPPVLRTSEAARFLCTSPKPSRQFTAKGRAHSIHTMRLANGGCEAATSHRDLPCQREA